MRWNLADSREIFNTEGAEDTEKSLLLCALCALCVEYLFCFRFRGRTEDHQHLSPLGRRLQWWGYFAIFPAMVGVLLFLHLTRQDDGRMAEFTGRANLLMLAIFTPSIVLFALALYVPKRFTWRCPQCSWESTLKAGETVDAPAGDPMRPEA